jgi:hypothetical protein
LTEGTADGAAPKKTKTKIRRATSTQSIANAAVREVLDAASHYYLAACMAEGQLFPDQKAKDKIAKEKILQTRANLRKMGRKVPLIPIDRPSLMMVMHPF